MAMEKINHTKKQGVSPGISVGGRSGKTHHWETGEEGKGARVQTAWHKIVDVRIRIMARGRCLKKRLSEDDACTPRDFTRLHTTSDRLHVTTALNFHRRVFNLWLPQESSSCSKRILRCFHCQRSNIFLQSPVQAMASNQRWSSILWSNSRRTHFVAVCVDQ